MISSGVVQRVREFHCERKPAVYVAGFTPIRHASRSGCAGQKKHLLGLAIKPKLFPKITDSIKSHTYPGSWLPSASCSRCCVAFCWLDGSMFSYKLLKPQLKRPNTTLKLAKQSLSTHGYGNYCACVECECGLPISFAH